MDGVDADTSAPSIELPSGYDDVDAFLEEARKRFRECCRDRQRQALATRRTDPLDVGRQC